MKPRVAAALAICIAGAAVAHPSALGADPAFREALRLEPSPRPLLRTTEAFALGGLMATTFLLDDEIRGAFRDEDVAGAFAPVSDTGRFLDPLGRSNRWRLAGGIVFAGGAIAGDEGIARTGVLLAAAATVNEAVTAGLKFGFGRYRPFREGHDAGDFRPFGWENTSLPSGHASSAFAAATIIAGRTDSGWIDGLAYGAASVVALERVIDEKHWATDVLLGAATGIICGRLVLMLDGGKPAAKTPEER